MAGLLDIAPASEKISVRGGEIEVFGISAKGVAYLLAKFPELRMMMAGRSIDQAKLMELSGDVVASIIAAGCGHPASPEHEEAAGRLTLEEQADMVEAIWRLTLPNGIGPFVDRLTALMGAVGSGPSNTAPATKSRKASTN